MNKNLSIFFPYAMLFCLVVMWGSAFAALKISLETISPLNVMSLRLIIGSIISLILLGVFPTGIATLLWFKIISLKGPLFLSLVNYLIPVWALFIGIFFLNEKINFVIGFGLIFITMGIWLIEKR